MLLDNGEEKKIQKKLKNIKIGIKSFHQVLLLNYLN